MGRIVGIDLGTCRSVVATMDGPRPRVLQNREAKNQTPSAVSLRKRKGKAGDGGVDLLCGDAAIDNMVMAHRDTIISVKRLMGRAFSDPEVQKVKGSFAYEVKEPADGTKDSVAIVLGGREHSPIDISAMILKKLKEDAEFRLGDEVTHAVVTVPAYFSQIQRDATRKAGMKAGLKITRILDEPTAAAIAFGLESEDSLEAKTLLVYDLGGGTFDISVLMWSGNVFVPLNLQGDMWLGGDNFDQIIVDHVVQRIQQEYGIDPRTNLRFMAGLKLKAREVKERLSSSDAADLIMPAALQDSGGDYIDVDMEITRNEFEHMARPLVDRSVQLVRTALENAGLKEADVNYIVMAGNSTCIPMVQKAMEDMFGREKVLRKVHPKECVALGTATLATRLGGIVCEAPDPADPERHCGTVNPLDAVQCSKCGAAFAAAGPDGERASPPVEPGCIAPFSYGTQSLGDKFNVFIKKNDPYPTQDGQALIFYTQRPDQRMISIPVYGGDNLIKASANEKQGEAFAVLPADMPEGTAVRIRLWLDGDGVFALSAHLENGTDLKPTILKGGVIQKTVQRLEELMEMLAEVKGTDPARAERIERAIDEVLNKIKGVSDDVSASDLGLGSDEWYDKLKNEAQSGAGGKSQEAQQAENAVGYVRFVERRYGWAINAMDQLRLDKAVTETSSALYAGDASAIRQRLAELIQVINSLPRSSGLSYGS